MRTSSSSTSASVSRIIRLRSSVPVQRLRSSRPRSLGSRTRVMPLAAQTRRDNARFFGGDLDAVPRHCLTQGIATILEARHIILLAAGTAKAAAVRELVEGPISVSWPATALQMHPRVTVLVDEAAGARLERVPVTAGT